MASKMAERNQKVMEKETTLADLDPITWCMQIVISDCDSQSLQTPETD